MHTKIISTACEHGTIELVLNHTAWQPGVRPQLADGRERFGVGSLRMRSSSLGERLYLDTVTLADRPPQGRDRIPLDDWFALKVLVAGDRTSDSARRLIERLAPTPSQSLAVLTLQPSGDGKAWCWDAALADRGGRVTPIDRVRIVGPEPIKLDRHEPADSLIAPADQENFSRLIGPIGLEAFARLRDLTATVVGLGRNGSLLAAELACLGVRRLRLVDADHVEPHNLDAMPLVHEKDVGLTKVRAVGRRLMAARPGLQVSCLARPVMEAVETLQALSSDLFFTTVDSDAARLAVSLLARETLTPHLDVATQVRRGPAGEMQISGDVRFLLPMAGCTRCVGGYADDAETLYEISAPPGSMQRGEVLPWSALRTGSLLSVNSIAVGAGVQMVFDYLGGRMPTSRWQRFAWTPDHGLQSDSATVAAAEGCGVCRRSK